VTAQATEQLAKAGIRLAAETASHFLFTRDNFIALVERRGAGFGAIGSTGMLTANGLAYLVWRGGQAFFKSKSAEVPAADAEVAEVRRFSQDLACCL
jgi:hypothetical protein